MAGKIKKIIDCIINTNSKGNQALSNLIKTKLMLKGINPDAYYYYSEDNPQVLEKLQNIINSANMGICITEEEKMDTTIAYSTKKDAKEAVRQIKNHFNNFDPKMIIFFASSCYTPEVISREMQNAFPNAQTIGCSTAGEIISGKMLKDSIVAMAFNSNIIADVKVEIIRDIQKQNKVPEAFASIEEHYGKKMKDLDFSEYVGIILFDGLSRAEEKIMETIGDLTDVVFIGGSAGDYLNFNTTYVYANGKTYTDSAVVALIKPAREFSFIKTQSFRELDEKLTPTKVNTEAREVIEFDNKPASKAYAEKLGIKEEELPDYFMKNPVGLMINNEPYVRSPQRVDGKKVVFYCNVSEGMELSILESTNMIEDTKKAIKNKINELGQISGIINFNCILRTQELEKEGLTTEYAKTFENIPTIGFNTYGEEYIGHVNQTSTMLIFK